MRSSERYRIETNSAFFHMKLTARQQEILTFIGNFQRAQKVPPSTRTIQKHFGFRAQTTVVTHLKSIAAKGALEQLGDGGSWGAKINAVQALLDLPVYGEIPAVLPSDEEQWRGEKISVDPRLFKVRATSRLWGLRIKGDSVIDAHIRDGDIAIFQQREPRIGEIIAALVDETTVTLRRLMIARGRKILRAANARYPDIMIASRLDCNGVMIGLIRNGSL